jgi:hypothetical protein
MLYAVLKKLPEFTICCQDFTGMGFLKKFHQGQATAGQLRKKAGFVLWLFPSLLERG